MLNDYWTNVQAYPVRSFAVSYKAILHRFPNFHGNLKMVFIIKPSVQGLNSKF